MIRNYARHYESLARFVAAVEQWQAAEVRGTLPSELEAELFRLLPSAEQALATANVAFRLYATRTTRETDNLRDAVYILRDTATPNFEPLLRQLNYALGRLRTAVEEAEDRVDETAATNPGTAVRERWRVLKLGWKVFIALGSIAASCGAVYTVWELLL